MKTNVRYERLYSTARFTEIGIQNTPQFLCNGAKELRWLRCEVDLLSEITSYIKELHANSITSAFDIWVEH